jgi:hypothetical protein
VAEKSIKEASDAKSKNSDGETKVDTEAVEKQVEENLDKKALDSKDNEKEPSAKAMK